MVLIHNPGAPEITMLCPTELPVAAAGTEPAGTTVGLGAGEDGRAVGVVVGAVGAGIGAVGVRAGVVGPTAGVVGLRTGMVGARAGVVGLRAGVVGVRVGVVGERAGVVGVRAGITEVRPGEVGLRAGVVGATARVVGAMRIDSWTHCVRLAFRLGPATGHVELLQHMGARGGKPARTVTSTQRVRLAGQRAPEPGEILGS